MDTANSFERLTPRFRTIGRRAALAVFVLSVIYAVTLVLGLLSLKSSQDPIGDPYFTLLELLIVLMAPLMVVCMVAVHDYASPQTKPYSLTALAFMILLAGITSSVHFTILTVSRQIATTQPSIVSALMSFRWPSVAYTLDILAWDLFLSLSMLFAAPVFTVGRLERRVRALMIVAGTLSLAGLIGIPFQDMSLRMIGVVGYAGVAPVAFLLLGSVFGRGRREEEGRGQ